jgi:hypothetical protein
MMLLLFWLGLGLFALLGVGCVLLVVMQLPGLWLMLLLAAGLQCLDAFVLHEDPGSAGWWALGIAFLLAVAGEVVETAAGAAGAHVGGGRRRGMVGALLGAMLGAVLGTFIIPIPVIGSLLGAIGGAFAGAMVGEMTGAQGRSVAAALKPASGAAAGRAAGTLAKCALAGIALVVLLVGFVLR